MVIYIFLSFFFHILWLFLQFFYFLFFDLVNGYFGSKISTDNYLFNDKKIIVKKIIFYILIFIKFIFIHIIFKFA
jgi:hypothetical protein